MPRACRHLLLLLLTLACATGALLIGHAAPSGAQEPPASSVRGTLIDNKGTADRADDVPVKGADVVVKAAAGDPVGTATSGDDGKFSIDLPAAGDYTATLDTSTLPSGVKVVDETKVTLAFHVDAGGSHIALFPLGKDTRRTTNKLDQAAQLAVDGVRFGLIIAMAAVGLSLIFGTTGLVNFAHGELVTWGALVAYFFNANLHVQLIPAAILAMLVAAATGGLLDLGLWRPLRRRGTGLIAMLVVSIGLAFFVRYLFLYIFGGRNRFYQDYTVQRGLHFGPVVVTPKDLVAMVIAVVALLAVGFMLQRTRLGKAMRAVSDNPDLAASSGIDVERVVLVVWMMGAALAALGGVLYGLRDQVSFQFGFQLLLLMFAGVTLGGLGTAYGALVGGFVIGLFVTMSTLWVAPELKNVGALLLLILVLLIRPQGILGRAERIG